MSSFAVQTHATHKPASPTVPRLAPATSAPSIAGRRPRIGSRFGSWPADGIGMQVASPLVLQAKLAVSAPTDSHEREADRLAAHVVHAPKSATTPHISGLKTTQVQRKCECGGACSDCKKGDEDATGLLQRKAAAPRPVSQPVTAHPILRTPGRALDTGTLSFMESRFGQSFSHVRVHDDIAAARTAAALQARAYTVGHHIVFGSGELQPGTSSGRELIAHELTHVLQQESGNATAGIQRKRRGAAGGCGICQGGDFRQIGSTVHAVVESAFGPLGTHVMGEHPVQVVPEGVPPPFTPELDLARETPNSPWGRIIEIGEIKPLDDAGNQVGIARQQLSDYYSQLIHVYDEVFRLTDLPPTGIPYPNPARPPGCPRQVIHVQLTEPGIYQYYCEPPWPELKANPQCNCQGEKKKKKKAHSKSAAKPKEQPKNAASPQPKAHIYLEEVDPVFDDLARRIRASEAAPGQELFVLIDSDFYAKRAQQQYADDMARKTRLLQVDPRSVPMLQMTAPLIPIAVVAGIIELPILVAALVAAVVVALPEEAAVGAGAVVVEGVEAAGAVGETATAAGTVGEAAVGATTGAATTTAVAAEGATEGGQVISITARLSQAVTSKQAAAAAAALVSSGVSEMDAAAAAQPLIGKHLAAVLRAPSAPPAHHLGEVVNLSGQKFTVVMRIGVR